MGQPGTAPIRFRATVSMPANPPMKASIRTEALCALGARTKAETVSLAMEDAVKRHLRQEGFDAVEAGVFDFSEIVETTGPRNANGSLKHSGDRNGGGAAQPDAGPLPDRQVRADQILLRSTSIAKGAETLTTPVNTSPSR